MLFDMEGTPIPAVKICSVLTSAFDSPPLLPVCSAYFGVYLFVTLVLLKPVNKYKL